MQEIALSDNLAQIELEINHRKTKRNYRFRKRRGMRCLIWL